MRWQCEVCEASGEESEAAKQHYLEQGHAVTFEDGDRYAADQEPQAEPEPAAEPELAPEMLAIREAFVAYRQAWIDAVGPDTAVVECHHCDGKGFFPRYIAPDPTRAQCSVCGGWGRVDNGSHVPMQGELDCRTCGARGWVDVPAAISAEAPVATPPAPILTVPYMAPPPAEIAS